MSWKEGLVHLAALYEDTGQSELLGPQLLLEGIPAYTHPLRKAGTEGG